MSKLHVVLSCTNRKRAHPPGSLRLGALLGTVEERATAWMKRLDAAYLDVEAERLYAGEYWTAGMALGATAKEKFDMSLWVLSAGFGLIGGSDWICAYGATLGAGHVDSVVGGHAKDGTASGQRRRWWAALSTWDGPVGVTGPRTLSSLAAMDPDAGLVVCAGQDYLDAVTPDLVEAQATLASAEQLVVLGSGSPTSDLAGSWVPVPGRLRTRLGGSMTSTGVRAARALIDALAPGDRLLADQARATVSRLVNESDPLPTFDRKRLDDHAVAEWIRVEARRNPLATKSSALRAFRDEGMACEQSRFGRLFATTVGAPS